MDAFAQGRTAQRAQRLGLAQLVCPGRHTVTGLLYTCGRQFQDWSADYKFFSKARWDSRTLFHPVLGGVLEMLPPAAPVVIALDDTLVRKTGRHIAGVAWRRDPLSPPFQTNLVLGQRFLQLSVMLPNQQPAGSARAIPIAFEHVPPIPKPKSSATEEEKQAYRQQKRIQNLSTHAVDDLRRVRQDLDQRPPAADRRLIAVVDGSFTNQTVLQNLPAQTTLVGRIRKDAKLFAPPRPEDQPAIGAKRKYGQPLPTPEQIRQDETIPWQEVQAFAAGKRHSFRVKTMAPVLWKKAGASLPLRLVVIAPVGYRPRKGSKLLYREPAYLICTDPELPLTQVIQDYLWRWDIEVNHRDEKQYIGVGEAQVRSPRSVDRHPAMAVASYAKLLLAAARAFGTETPRGRLPLPKWHTQAENQRLSTPELLRQLRSEVWSYALGELLAHSDDFATMQGGVTKCPESQLPVVSALLYATAS
jgi:hypothetical protein